MSSKSLVPYSDEYVLIHKRALFVNNFTMSIIVQYLQQSIKDFSENSLESIMAGFAQMAIDESNKLTDQQITEIILEGIIQQYNSTSSVSKVHFGKDS
jgi:isopropylmalate/homocitrate/citramalate synthase